MIKIISGPAAAGLVVFMLSFSTAWGATFYVATTGSDATGDGSANNPYASIGKALTTMQGGDTLIVKNGIYSDRAGMLVNDRPSANIPSGSPSAFTTIKAETPYGVRLKWTGGLNYYDAPVLIQRAQYVQVDGFIYEMLNLDDPQYVVEIDSSKVKVTRSIVKRNQVDAYGGWYAIGGSDDLIEDAAGVGAARYGFYAAGPDSTSQRNIFRRCVGRMDYANTAQPKATFAVYGNNSTTDVRNYLLQNTIAIDGQKPDSNGGEQKYGGYYNPKNATNVHYQGSMVLHEAAYYSGMFAQEWGTGINVENSVVWDLPLPDSWNGAVGIRANTASYITASSVTLGGVLPGGCQTGVTLASDSACGGAHANLLNNTPGAIILNQYGVSGTFWGDTGYDQLTSQPLWPWPYEANIKAVFSEPLTPPSGYTPATNNSTRGFAAGGAGLYGGPITLTSYIWEYLGTACPANICSGAAPPPVDTTPPSVPTNLSAVAVSSTQINLSWSASTDNVGVAGYRIFRGSSQIATTASTSYSNAGLTPSTAYTYTVAAYDAAGNVSAQSASASAATQAAPPPPPTLVPPARPSGLRIR